MIRIAERSLDDETATQLKNFQAEVDEGPDYPARVIRARERFAAYNVKTNSTFEAIKAVLNEMCSGARRCMYCEDSAADEVEHFKPKNFYPEFTFDWANYLYVCGQCNISKRDKFALRLSTGIVHQLTRKREKVPIEPPAGQHVLLNPRIESSVLLLQLDIINTFAFVPAASMSADDTERAQYTIATLGLNRDLLLRARREAYTHYVAKLKEYVTLKEEEPGSSHLFALRSQLGSSQHPSVWIEMQRSRHAVQTLAQLFHEAPELIDYQ